MVINPGTWIGPGVIEQASLGTGEQTFPNLL